MDPNIFQDLKPCSRWSFMALLYSVLGWALFEGWLFVIGAGIRLHILVAIPGIALTVRSARYSAIEGSNAIAEKKKRATQWFEIGTSCTMLFAFGVVLGTLTLVGSVTFLGLLAASFIFLPWNRIPFSHNHLVASCAIAMTGFAAILAIDHQSLEFMSLPLAAWAFWLCACCALILRADRKTRIRSKMDAIDIPGTAYTKPQPAHSNG